jgi:hypothetical protein
MNTASLQLSLKKQFKIEQEPWENYLAHDSKYVLPILCHSKSRDIEEQMLAARFITKSVQDETISEYKVKGDLLLKELVTFAKEFKDDDEHPSILDKMKDLLKKDKVEITEMEQVDKELDRIIKMFYLDMRVKGLINEFKEDYFI